MTGSAHDLQGAAVPTPTIDTDAVGITDTSALRTGTVVEQLIAPLSTHRIEDVDVDRLHEHPDNPRGQVGDVSELADSIRASGIYEPLVVVPAMTAAAAASPIDCQDGFQTILKLPTYGYYRGMGSSKEAPLDWLEEDGVDVSDHEHFACHAVAVGYPRSGSDEVKVVPVCTNPKAHPGSKIAKQNAERDKAEAQAARAKVKAAQRKQQRLEVIGALCGESIDTTAESVALAALAEETFEYFYDDDARDLCTVLGLTVADDETVGVAEDALREFVAGGDKNIRRFAVASQLLLVEGKHYHAFAGRFLALLGSRGYALDRDERAVVAKHEKAAG